MCNCYLLLEISVAQERNIGALFSECWHAKDSIAQHRSCPDKLCKCEQNYIHKTICNGNVLGFCCNRKATMPPHSTHHCSPFTCYYYYLFLISACTHTENWQNWKNISCVPEPTVSASTMGKRTIEIFEIQCNNGMAGCQKQALNQRPLPICSACSSGILNRPKIEQNWMSE